MNHKITGMQDLKKVEVDRYLELKVVPKDDDLVEDDEVYYLITDHDTLHKRVAATNPSTTKIVIKMMMVSK